VIDTYLGRFSPQFYALLRIVSGFMFLLHGTQKFFNFPPSGKPPMPESTLMTVGAGIEVVAGLMIMIGLFAGLAAFIASGEMAVAYFLFHQAMGALPIQNGGELAALYSFVFLYIAATGSGVWSVDSARRSVGTTKPVDV